MTIAAADVVLTDDEIAAAKMYGLRIAEKHPAHYIVTERVAPIVAEWVDRNEAGLEALGFLSGVPVRTIYRIINHDVPFWNPKISKFSLNSTVLQLDTVDRLFCAMNCVGLFHVGPESGGFADVYFHPSIIDADLDDDAVVGAAWSDEVELPVAA